MNNIYKFGITVAIMVITLAWSGLMHAQDSKPNSEQEIPLEMQKMMEDAKKIDSMPSESLKNDLAIQTEKTPESNKTPTYPYTLNEQLVIYGVSLCFLLLNIVGSIYLPKLRYLFIGSPFDIGVKEEKTDSQQAVQRKRNKIEFILLLIIVLFYAWFVSGGKNFDTENLLGAASVSILFAITAYLFYVITRLIIGFKSRCPSCKNMFAVSCTNSYKEPKTSYEEKSSLSSGGRKGHQVKVYEVGIQHNDYICSVCNHTWHTSKQYKDIKNTYNTV